MTTLRTKRFVLQPPAVDDVRALARHWREPDVRRYLWDDKVIELDAVHEVVATSVNDHTSNGWGGWVVRAKARIGPIVGWCGLHVGPPDGTPASEMLVELTYSLDKAWWGTGAAVEAATAVLDHVFWHAPLDAVFAGFDEPNRRSAATLRRLGFVPDRVVLLDVGPTPYWRLSRKDWRDRRPPMANRTA